jgi:hypothetical protein
MDENEMDVYLAVIDEIEHRDLIRLANLVEVEWLEVEEMGEQT